MSWFNNLALIIAILFLLLAVAVLIFLSYFNGHKIFGGTLKMGNSAKKPRDE